MIWKEHKQNIFTRDAMIQKKKKKTEHKQNNSPKITIALKRRQLMTSMARGEN